ncbi:S1 RNA-binding domain-containing protein [Paenibacillus sp. FJAT-26967]|uniref:CvfB family protein n=1 Tax=Paenibacillus sp. FJAT-26967 TaxID=1729690 RepID=UPI000838E329|nr:S1-like domain-containing RNA-binding protein [Paenibacillus sp. FJAT-26967]
MNLEAGTLVTLDVAREVSPYGYFMTDGERDVLLHYTETTTKVAPGDRLEVFLYYDTEDRLAATMHRPMLLLGELALLEVVDLHPRFGAFLEMGIGRNLLLPFKEMPELEELRPQVGDRIYVTMDHDRQGRLVARLAGEEVLMNECFPAPQTWRNQWKNARVYKPLQMGTFVVVDGGVVGFGAIGLIPASERDRLLRVGEEVSVRVTYIREDGRINLSMRQPKEKGRDLDAERILEVLRERPNGAMPYSDQTGADVIMTKFGISKSAFKRALGKLMKDGLVYQKENWTCLKQEEN